MGAGDHVRRPQRGADARGAGLLPVALVNRAGHDAFEKQVLHPLLELPDQDHPPVEVEEEIDCISVVTHGVSNVLQAAQKLRRFRAVDHVVIHRQGDYRERTDDDPAVVDHRPLRVCPTAKPRLCSGGMMIRKLSTGNIPRLLTVMQPPERLARLTRPPRIRSTIRSILGLNLCQRQPMPWTAGKYSFRSWLTARHTSMAWCGKKCSSSACAVKLGNRLIDSATVRTKKASNEIFLRGLPDQRLPRLDHGRHIDRGRQVDGGDFAIAAGDGAGDGELLFGEIAGS